MTRPVRHRRGPKPEPLTEVMSLRLTRAEQDAWRNLAERNSTSVSELLRSLVDERLAAERRPIAPTCRAGKPGTWSSGFAPCCELPVYHLPHSPHMWADPVSGWVEVWSDDWSETVLRSGWLRLDYDAEVVTTGG